MAEGLNREKDVSRRLSKPKKAPRTPVLYENYEIVPNSFGDVHMFGSREPVSINTSHVQMPMQQKKK